jgi:hypothetical protein
VLPLPSWSGTEIWIFRLRGGSESPVKGIQIFSGSGGAHESVVKDMVKCAMLICQIIAGRVRDGYGTNSDF